nr:MAG TPA: hypothetical protein [Caudoviricetes sp.]
MAYKKLSSTSKGCADDSAHLFYSRRTQKLDFRSRV